MTVPGSRHIIFICLPKSATNWVPGDDATVPENVTGWVPGGTTPAALLSSACDESNHLKREEREEKENEQREAKRVRITHDLIPIQTCELHESAHLDELLTLLRWELVVNLR